MQGALTYIDNLYTIDYGPYIRQHQRGGGRVDRLLTLPIKWLFQFLSKCIPKTRSQPHMH